MRQHLAISSRDKRYTSYKNAQCFSEPEQCPLKVIVFPDPFGRSSDSQQTVHFHSYSASNNPIEEGNRPCL